MPSRPVEGYRDVALPEPTRHTHFPPGYPAGPGALWSITGRSLPAAHLFSCACTVAATIAAWLWFRCLYPPPCRIYPGSGPGSELDLGTIRRCNPLGADVPAPGTTRPAGSGPCWSARWYHSGVIVGALLAACVLTRHVGVSVAGAVGIDLLIRRRWATAVAAGLTMGALLLPWIGWLTLAGTPNQAGLLALNDQGFGDRITSLAIFYLQRLPDQLTGPFVEIGTVFQHRTWS